MLLSLTVRNLALIENAEVEFKDGLNILTGETGAGKSIIIGSINIALGGKVPKDIIRSNAEFAFVELVFEITDEYSLNQLKKLDIFMEDNKLIISRKITKSRNISKINGETVTASVLKKIAEIVIDIHGQHEHQSLLNKQKHIEILDEFAKEKLSEPKDEMLQIYNLYNDYKKKLNSMDMDESVREREISFLNFEISEIENANIIAGEDVELENRFKKMINAQKIGFSLNNIYQMTDADDMNISQLVGNCVHEISSISSYDEELNSMSEQLFQIEDLINDFARDVSVYLEDLEFDEQEYNDVSKRLDLINALKSKHGNSIENILLSLEEKKQRLSELENYSKNIQMIKKEIITCEERMCELSSKITSIRQEYAKILVDDIRKALSDMNFLDVKFEISFSKKENYSSSGIDDAEFLISTNPGEKLQPLGKVASGGELSRIMLAVKTVLALKDHVDTMIFDEIDVGISGRTAQKISEKMGMLAHDKQVICITHLPQIAAMADCHFVIKKDVVNNETVTSIQPLSDEEIYYELARLLGGAKITQTVIDNAKEMKHLAKSTKNN